MKIYQNILISSLTTMRIGGPTRYVIEIETPQDISDAYGFCETYWLPSFVLGGGANTLGHDDGFSGAILINRMRGISDDGAGLLKIMGGEPWDNVVDYACNRNYSGIEALSKIPGLAGAAPIQNIGAYGQDVSGVFQSADAYDTVTRSFRTLAPADLDFSYRKSALNTSLKNRFFIISLTLKLNPNAKLPRPFYNSIETYIKNHHITDFTPQSIREIVSKIRADKLPDPAEKASSGSFFKNVYLDQSAAEKAEEKGYPIHRGADGNKINAGWLIEQAGFKGKLLYGMRVNEKSALNLINESAGTYENLSKARAAIVSTVYDKFGYWLEQEPVEIYNPDPKRNPRAFQKPKEGALQ